MHQVHTTTDRDKLQQICNQCGKAFRPSQTTPPHPTTPLLDQLQSGRGPVADTLQQHQVLGSCLTTALTEDLDQREYQGGY